jgi:hypothetical protein
MRLRYEVGWARFLGLSLLQLRERFRFQARTCGSPCGPDGCPGWTLRGALGEIHAYPPNMEEELGRDYEALIARGRQVADR